MFDPIIKRIASALETSEAWCILLALIWVASAKWLGMPEQISVGELGAISPAYLLAIALVRILPKIATPGEVPFVKPYQPAVKPAEPAKLPADLVPLVLVGLLVAGTASASPPAVGMARLAGGISAGGVAYEDAGGLTLGDTTIQPWLSYSVTSALAFHGTTEYQAGHDLWMTRAGAHVALKKGPKLQSFAGVDAIWYGGDGLSALSSDWGWGPYLQVGWPLMRNDKGAARVFAVGNVQADFENPDPIFKLLLRWQAFGGETR